MEYKLNYDLFVVVEPHRPAEYRLGKSPKDFINGIPVKVGYTDKFIVWADSDREVLNYEMNFNLKRNDKLIPIRGTAVFEGLGFEDAMDMIDVFDWVRDELIIPLEPRLRIEEFTGECEECENVTHLYEYGKKMLCEECIVKELEYDANDAIEYALDNLDDFLLHKKQVALDYAKRLEEARG